jgi:hypothetical protein
MKAKEFLSKHARAARLATFFTLVAVFILLLSWGKNFPRPPNRLLLSNCKLTNMECQNSSVSTSGKASSGIVFFGPCTLQECACD